MNRFLFTDGIQGVKEVQTASELRSMVEETGHPEKVRVWIFNSNEWISYAAFLQQYPTPPGLQKTSARIITETETSKSNPHKWLKKFLFLVLLTSGAFLIFNFTNVKWTKVEPLRSTAVRPANTPVLNIDSLISTIEFERQKTLDRNTRINLRLRNSWPERILLKLNATKETSSAGTRFSELNISIDNTTGYFIDQAIVNLKVWNNGKASDADTLLFNGIRYDQLALRQVKRIIKADSVSLSFGSIKAKAFNFCYSADVKNNSGNYNDRWFCILK